MRKFSIVAVVIMLTYLQWTYYLWLSA